jgi:hypothetical protein
MRDMDVRGCYEIRTTDHVSSPNPKPSHIFHILHPSKYIIPHPTKTHVPLPPIQSIPCRKSLPSHVYTQMTWKRSLHIILPSHVCKSRVRRQRQTASATSASSPLPNWNISVAISAATQRSVHLSAPCAASRTRASESSHVLYLQCNGNVDAWE